MRDVAEQIHADIDALKELRDALARFRHAQREVVDRGDARLPGNQGGPVGVPAGPPAG